MKSPRTCAQLAAELLALTPEQQQLPAMVWDSGSCQFINAGLPTVEPAAPDRGLMPYEGAPEGAFVDIS